MNLKKLIIKAATTYIYTFKEIVNVDIQIELRTIIHTSSIIIAQDLSCGGIYILKQLTVS